MTTRITIAKTVAAAALAAACALGAAGPASAQESALCRRDTPPAPETTTTTRPENPPNTRSLNCNSGGPQGKTPSTTQPPTTQTTNPPTTQTSRPQTTTTQHSQPQTSQPAVSQPGGRGSNRQTVVERAQPAQAETREELPMTGDHTGQLTALGLGLIAAGVSASGVARRRTAGSL